MKTAFTAAWVTSFVNHHTENPAVLKALPVFKQMYFYLCRFIVSKCTSPVMLLQAL